MPSSLDRATSTCFSRSTSVLLLLISPLAASRSSSLVSLASVKSWRHPSRSALTFRSMEPRRST